VNEAQTSGTSIRTSPRFRILLSLAVAGVLACDPFFRVAAVAPLARPLPDRCLDSTFRGIAYPARSDAPARRDTALVAGLPYSALTQHVYKDSTAALEVSVYRIGKFGAAEADSIGHVLGGTLVHVRDACGGTAPPGSAGYMIHRNKLGKGKAAA
jgi:hypothetical protein